LASSGRDRTKREGSRVRKVRVPGSEFWRPMPFWTTSIENVELGTRTFEPVNLRTFEPSV
jgi:hypothetical protein